MNKKIKYIYLLALMLCLCVSNAYSEDAKIPCLKKDGSIGLQGLDKYDCTMVKAAVNVPTFKDPYQKSIWNNLADSLAIKVTQRLQDIALLDQYFSQNNDDLVMGSKEVQTDCKLDVIAKPICENGNSKQYLKKLEILKSKFPNSNASTSLYERMRDEFSGMREVKTSGNTCPISGATGYFQLSSQLVDLRADKFVDSIKSVKNSPSVSNTVKRDAFYNSFPQLRLLRASIKNGVDGENMLQEFEQLMKDSDGKESSLNLIKKFLFSKDTKKQLAISLASQCRDISANVKNFLCNDFTSLAMPKDLSDDYFAAEEDDTNKEIAKAFSCNSKKVDDAEEVKILSGQGTIASLDKQIKTDTRKNLDDPNMARKAVNVFCDFYSCNTSESKKLPSCIAGGPVASKDILQAYCKDFNSSSCITDYMTYISFISSIEKDKSAKEPIQSIANDKSSDLNIKSKGHSFFYENFVSVNTDITPLPETKKLTQITEERSTDLIEKKSFTQAPASTTTPAQPKEAVRQVAESREEALPSTYESSNSGSAGRESDQFRKSFVPQFSKSIDMPQAAAKVKKVADSGDSDSRLDELKKLRGELSDAISKIKGTDDEKLAAIADNNEVAITAKGTKKDSTKNLNQGEKDRLDSYRDSLSNWESKLRNWQGQLSDRDVRANSGNAVSANDGRPASANGDQSGSSSGSSGNAKLSKTTAGAAGATGAKADGAGERAPGSEKGDLEQGIVSSEKLATLQKDSLSKLGIVASDSFIIKVRFQEKIYAIPVKTFTHDGKSMFVPLLNDKNRELSKIVFESPLFRDYRNYQVDRQYKLDAR